MVIDFDKYIETQTYNRPFTQKQDSEDADLEEIVKVQHTSETEYVIWFMPENDNVQSSFSQTESIGA